MEHQQVLWQASEATRFKRKEEEIVAKGSTHKGFYQNRIQSLRHNNSSHLLKIELGVLFEESCQYLRVLQGFQGKDRAAEGRNGKDK